MPNPESLKAWGELLRGAGYCLWPVFSLVVAIVFKKDIKTVLGRLKKGSAFGAAIELSDLEKLDQQTRKLESEGTRPLPPPEPPALVKGPAIDSTPDSQKTRTDSQKTRTVDTGSIVRLHRRDHVQSREHDGEPSVGKPQVGLTKDLENIVDVARTSPQLAVISLSMRLERQVDLLMAVSGLWPEHSSSFLANLEKLEKRQYITPDMRSAASTFWRVRNPLVHGRSVPQEEIVSAIDSGMRIYESMLNIPKKPQVVIHGDLLLYPTEECVTPIEAVIGVMLSTGGTGDTINVFASTRRSYYEPGMQVSWEWNADIALGEAWYRDPDTERPTFAFSGCMNFVGRDLTEII